jgi:LPS-assembly lipoprotein
MWWQRNRSNQQRAGNPWLAVCGALSFIWLSACGFQPMYGDQALTSGGTPLRGNITIAPMVGHEGQIFKTALEDRFNPEGLDTHNAEYHLSIALTKTIIPAVIKSDGTIQRYDMRFDSDFKLTKSGHIMPIYTGKIRRTGSYNAATNANFATYEAEQDIIQRTLQEMAEDYVLRISGYIAVHANDKLKDDTVTPAPAKPEP